MTPNGPQTQTAHWRSLLPGVLVAAGMIAYHNSFSGPFILDDVSSIVENFDIRTPWPPWNLLAGTIRPVTDLSFALNFAMGGLQVWGYHALNLAIHLLAGLTLFGIIRRTLRGKLLQARYGTSAPWIALTVAILWTVHPLQTQSVTYIVQRAESLMGLFYLLTLYSFIRSAEPEKQTFWSILTVVACALGMACKPVMVTAPFMVLLYDRVFLAGSVIRSVRKRKRLYLGLAAAWGLLAILLTLKPMATAGPGLKEITPLLYAGTQPEVLLTYLKLTLWPHPLCFDYGWPIAQTGGGILGPALVIAGLGILTLWTYLKNPALGFVGITFFLILAPSSSLIPIKDPIFEYRMYLPLAALILLGVLGGDRLFHRLFSSPQLRRTLSAGLAIALVTALCAATIRRNTDYQSEVGIWQDTVTKRPLNPRAHNALGLALGKVGGKEKAILHYHESLRLDPDYVDAHNNLGTVLAREGQLEEAKALFAQALKLNPRSPDAHNNMGRTLAEEGKFEEAMPYYKKALQLNRYHVKAFVNLGKALTEAGQFQEAVVSFREALRLEPNDSEAHHNLGVALAHQDKFQGAIQHYTKALALGFSSWKMHHNLGLALSRQGRIEEAISHYRKAVSMNPDNAQTHNNLGALLFQQGKVQEAEEQFLEALTEQPDDLQLHRNLGLLYLRQGRPKEAAHHFERTVRLEPTSAQNHNNLGIVLAQQGKLKEALAHFKKALELQPDLQAARDNLEQLRQQRLKPGN